MILSCILNEKISKDLSILIRTILLICKHVESFIFVAERQYFPSIDLP